MTRPNNLTYPLIGAAMMIAAPLLLVLARSFGWIADPNGEIAQRIVQIAIGLMVAAYGNVAPRQLVRYDPDAAGPSRRQALIRFSGWVFTLAGLAYALAWLVAPYDSAPFWSMAPMAFGVAVVLLRCAGERLRTPA